MKQLFSLFVCLGLALLVPMTARSQTQYSLGPTLMLATLSADEAEDDRLTQIGALLRVRSGKGNVRYGPTLGLGYFWASSNASFMGIEVDADITGFALPLQMGVDFKVGANFLFGLEAGIQVYSGTLEATISGGGFGESVEIDFSGVGFLASPRVAFLTTNGAEIGLSYQYAPSWGGDEDTLGDITMSGIQFSAVFPLGRK